MSVGESSYQYLEFELSIHIACHLCDLDLFPVKAKEAVPLHERGIVDAPGALEAAKEVDYVARAHIEGGRSVIWFDSGLTRLIVSIRLPLA